MPWRSRRSVGPGTYRSPRHPTHFIQHCLLSYLTTYNVAGRSICQALPVRRWICRSNCLDCSVHRISSPASAVMSAVALSILRCK